MCTNTNNINMPILFSCVHMHVGRKVHRKAQHIHVLNLFLIIMLAR